MTEQRFTVVAARGTVTSVAAASLPRASAWETARKFRADGYRVWIVSEDFAEVFVSDDQSLDDPPVPSGDSS